MTTAGKEGHDVRIESTHPAEPGTVEPEVNEPEMNEPEGGEPEAAAWKSERDEHTERNGYEPAVAESDAAEPEAETETERRADEQSEVAEPVTVAPHTGIYEHPDYEPPLAERADEEPDTGTEERAHEEPEVADPVAATPYTGIHEGVGEEHMADEPAADEFAAAESEADEPAAYAPATAQPVTNGAVSNTSMSTEPPNLDAPLIASDESTRFHEQIHQIQGTFVDDPRQSVRDAEHLLEDIVRSLAAGLEERRRALTPMGREDGSGTEELRQALRSYRSLAVQLLGPEN